MFMVNPIAITYVKKHRRQLDYKKMLGAIMMNEIRNIKGGKSFAC